MAEFATAGGKLKTVNSVASFFVSRVDTEVDPRLEKIGTPEALALRGKAAIANARAAYGLFLEQFRSDEWLQLGMAGGRVQRPLWASTSTKNPAYPRHDVHHRSWWHRTPSTPCRWKRSTPTRTMASRCHSRSGPCEFERKRIAPSIELEEVGIDMEDVTRVLEEQGVEKFSKSWEDLLADVEKKRAELA